MSRPIISSGSVVTRVAGKNDMARIVCWSWVHYLSLRVTMYLLWLLHHSAPVSLLGDLTEVSIKWKWGSFNITVNRISDCLLYDCFTNKKCTSGFSLLPRVGRDCWLWHSSPHCAVDGTTTAPEVGATERRSCCGRRCRCGWVGKPRNWWRKRGWKQQG